MSFFVFAADLLCKVVVSLGTRSLGEGLKSARTQRRMDRLVADAVDRIVEQTEAYLTTEKLKDGQKRLLMTALCAKLDILTRDPQRFFAGSLDGALLFKQCHPGGELPQEIREEGLDQFYSVLFPQIAHFVSGAGVALGQWRAEGFREEFKRLSQLAEEIRAMNVKVTELPTAVAGALRDKEEAAAENLLRVFAQTLLNHLLLKLDLSPLRAERLLQGTLRDHYVAPAIRRQASKKEPEAPIEPRELVIAALTDAGARRVLHAGAGVGKSTCALWLQASLLQADRLAVNVRLRETPDIEKRSLIELLRERAGVHLKESLTNEVLQRWSAAGRLVLILDGFDEIPEGRRDAVQAWITGLAVALTGITVIVTSRPLQSGHLEELPTPWETWDLLPFDTARIVEFIRRWHQHLPDHELSPEDRNVDAASLAALFSSDPSLKPLADTPLMLGTLLFVHHRDKKLPSGRVDLYERYIAAMLGLRDSGSGIEARATKLTDKEKRRLLAEVALHFHLNGLNEVNDETMHWLVGEALAKLRYQEEISRLLPALSERSGLLQGPGAWSFTHKTIGEFLVAELVCDGTVRLPDQRRLDRKELWKHRHTDGWTAVLFFWAGKASAHELEEFLEELLHEATTEATTLALSLLNDQGERLSAQTQRDLALRIIERFPSDLDPPARVGFLTPLPDSLYQHLLAPRIELRGFVSDDLTNACKNLIIRNVLFASDAERCRADLRDVLTVGTFHAIEASGLPLRAARDLSHLNLPHLAALCLRTVTLRDFGKEDLESGLEEWLSAIPEGRGWLQLTLMGLLCLFAPDSLALVKAKLGPALWNRIHLPVARDWLKESHRYRDGHRSRLWADKTTDILATTRDLLMSDGPTPWRLTTEQHADLVRYCATLITEREALHQAVTT